MLTYIIRRLLYSTVVLVLASFLVFTFVTVSGDPLAGLRIAPNVSELTVQIPFYGQRHSVRPGLTGWAQVRYTYGASLEDAMEKLQYDLFYIKNLSIALDLYIIVNTVKTVVLRRGA